MLILVLSSARGARRFFAIGKYYKLNQRILAEKLRVIGPDGAQLGVLPRDEALDKALELGLDLVEIAANAVPPVAKIIDFNKFLYEEGKKEQAAKKHAKDVELKELWFTPRVAEHDMITRLRRVDEFLGDNNKILVRIKFTGREMAHRELGKVVLNKILDYLGEKVAIERDAKFEGRSLTVILGKNKVKKTEKEEQDVKEEQIKNT